MAYIANLNRYKPYSLDTSGLVKGKSKVTAKSYVVKFLVFTFSTSHRKICAQFGLYWPKGLGKEGLNLYLRLSPREERRRPSFEKKLWNLLGTDALCHV